MCKKALIVWGGWEGHEPKQVAEIFSAILKGLGFDVEVSDTLNSFADKEKLKTLSLIVPIWTMGEINNDYVTNVLQAVESGVGIAGCHGGMCDAFRSNTNWHFLTGAQWVAHPGDEITYTINIKKNSSSPIVENINDFVITSEQYYIHIDPAANVLATTRFPVADGPYAANGEVDVPVVFTKMWGNGRVFYSSLGHSAKDFDIYEVRKLMENGFKWAAK
ncbi:MAG TPA: ThuA domain-containing protein [Clostridia bacterium]|nr:ThuA domain-containing protein [Clostridia bacterium]